MKKSSLRIRSVLSGRNLEHVRMRMSTAKAHSEGEAANGKAVLNTNGVVECPDGARIPLKICFGDKWDLIRAATFEDGAMMAESAPSRKDTLRKMAAGGLRVGPFINFLAELTETDWSALVELTLKGEDESASVARTKEWTNSTTMKKLGFEPSKAMRMEAAYINRVEMLQVEFDYEEEKENDAANGTARAKKSNKAQKKEKAAVASDEVMPAEQAEQSEENGAKDARVKLSDDDNALAEMSEDEMMRIARAELEKERQEEETKAATKRSRQRIEELKAQLREGARAEKEEKTKVVSNKWQITGQQLLDQAFSFYCCAEFALSRSTAIHVREEIINRMRTEDSAITSTDHIRLVLKCIGILAKRGRTSEQIAAIKSVGDEEGISKRNVSTLWVDMQLGPMLPGHHVFLFTKSQQALLGVNESLRLEPSRKRKEASSADTARSKRRRTNQTHLPH